MKKLFSIFILVSIFAGISFDSHAKNLVLLHTNDTHSQLDPASDGMGGVLRRKVLIDSIRRANDNVLLIDAGDAVQGTLYFTLYGGEVETKAMNLLGYDLAILGNHDFDNGLESLAKNLANSDATWITTNYDIRNTPLDKYMVPYEIKEYDGKKIAFIGINLNPDGMISSRNYKGMGYEDVYKAANSTAWHLKHNERADMVVALTHIGYEDSELPDDIKLAKQSEDIDIIIGGHSHTIVNPSNLGGKQYLIKNANGKEVLVAQTGKMGKYLGEIVIDLDKLTPNYRLIPVDSRLDSRIDYAEADILKPYISRIDSLMNIKVAKTADVVDQQQLANLFGDLVLARGKELAGKNVDFGLINNGGIRNSFPKGIVSEGHVMMTLPFDNKIEVIKVKGSELQKVFDKMAERGINGLSANVSMKYSPATKTCSDILINGKPLDTEREYLVSTIDYLANGGDYLVWLKDAPKIATSANVLSRDITEALKKIKGRLNPTGIPRIVVGE